MAITHKGMSMLLKHHALNATTSTDEDVKNCIDRAIKNSDPATQEETEAGDEDSEGEGDGEDVVENRATELEKENAELKAKLAKANRPLHVPNRAKNPGVNVDEELSEENESSAIREAHLIKNRAEEIKKTGVPGATAFLRARTEIREELGAGMHGK